jgi:hypothetical protein
LKGVCLINKTILTKSFVCLGGLEQTSFFKNPKKMLTLTHTQKRENELQIDAASRIKQARSFLRYVETRYGLPYKVLYERHEKSNRPIKIWEGVRLTAIRTAALAIIRTNMNLKDEQLAKVFELDRTSVIHYRQQWKNLEWTKDEFFTMNLDVCSEVWETFKLARC